MNKCNHDFVLYSDNGWLRWRCYKCGMFLLDIPDNELDIFGLILKKELKKTRKEKEKEMEGNGVKQ